MNIKFLIFTFFLLVISAASSCNYNTQSDCQAFSCEWKNGTCIQASASCLTGEVYINASSTCQACSSLSQTACSSYCTNYYWNSVACISCSTIDQNCLSCANDQCSSCKNGFQLNSDHNLECLPLPCLIHNCLSCIDSSTCFTCITGYKPSTTQTECINSECSISSCLSCLNSTACAVCLDGYQLSFDQKTCTLKCQDPFCTSCQSANTCAACATQYNYNSATGLCKLTCQDLKCIQCDIANRCNQCITNYQIQPNTFTCSPICQVANCYSCSAGPASCSSCNQQYTLITNSSGVYCLRDTCNIQGCLYCETATTCLSCAQGTTINSDKTRCVQNCLATIPLCTICATTTTCQICNPGYLASTSGQCNPFCSISNCLICSTSNTCSNCLPNYALASSNTKCNINCGINYCASCATLTTCSQCVSSFILGNDNTICYPICSLSFYFDQASSSCLTCSSSITNCRTCIVSSSVTICKTCIDTYYLTGSGLCGICSVPLANCLLCSSRFTCTQCNSGYVINPLTGGCVSTANCTVLNCLSCAIGDSNKCIVCDKGFLVSSGNCNSISCYTGQKFDYDSQSCLCPIGSFLTGTFCSPCSTNNCQTCNTAGCTSCINRYFLSGSTCLSCSTNCLTCSSQTNCQTCDYQYKLKDGSCIKTNTNSQSDYTDDNGVVKTVACPPGCLSCYATKNNIACITLQPGYAKDSNGNIIACNSQCKSCLSSNPAYCTQCHGQSTLINGDCSGCSDPNALTCNAARTYSLTCVQGYTAVLGVCKACAAYCLSCDLNGPDKCDANQCIENYVNLASTKNCTACYAGCSVCNRNNPSICLSSQVMAPATCSQNCLACSSVTVCTFCMRNYVLSSTKSCIAAIPYPCLTQTDTKCTSCYDKYTLNSAGVCVADVSCSANSTCISCPKQYYLSNKKCLACPSSLKNCDYCDSNNLNNCIKCSSGYYLNKNNCLSCPNGCIDCKSDRFCSKASTGYFLAVNRIGQYTGVFQACDSNCLTCVASSFHCTSCKSGMFLLGAHCFNNAYIKGSLVLKPIQSQKLVSGGWYNETDTKQRRMATLFMQTNHIHTSVLYTYRGNDRRDISITNIADGSVIVDIIANAEGDSNTAYNNFASNIQSLGVPDFQVVSSSLTPVGFTQENLLATNLGLILGVAIPLILLLIIIILFLKLRKQNIDGKQSQMTDKQIEDIQM